MNGNPIDLDLILGFRPFFKPDFIDWLAPNWHIYEAFERQALRVVARGRTHYSARTIVEVLVHESNVTEAPGREFKIGNDRAPDLARLFSIRHPEHARLWEYRRHDWREFLAAIDRLCAAAHTNHNCDDLFA